MCVHWRNVCFPSDIFWFCHLNGKLSLQRVSVRWGERCQPWFTFYDAITQVQIGCNTYASVMRSLKTFAAFKHCTWIYVLLLYAAQCLKMLQKCLSLLLCAQCFKITQNLAFEIWHFPPIFGLLKLTCLVALFDRKLQVFKNSPKWTIFGIFT